MYIDAENTVCDVQAASYKRHSQEFFGRNFSLDVADFYECIVG